MYYNEIRKMTDLELDKKEKQLQDQLRYKSGKAGTEVMDKLSYIQMEIRRRERLNKML